MPRSMGRFSLRMRGRVRWPNLRRGGRPTMDVQWAWYAQLQPAATTDSVALADRPESSNTRATGVRYERANRPEQLSATRDSRWEADSLIRRRGRNWYYRRRRGWRMASTRNPLAERPRVPRYRLPGSTNNSATTRQAPGSLRRPNTRRRPRPDYRHSIETFVRLLAEHSGWVEPESTPPPDSEGERERRLPIEIQMRNQLRSGNYNLPIPLAVQRMRMRRWLRWAQVRARVRPTSVQANWRLLEGRNYVEAWLSLRLYVIRVHRQLLRYQSRSALSSNLVGHAGMRPMPLRRD